jgi:sugar lactone lactonase YvrE
LDITVIAGGCNATASMLPRDVAVDVSGSVYYTDVTNNTIRKIDNLGTNSLVAGTGLAGFSGDGGLATGAQLDSPSGISFDSDGNMYIADTSNQKVRKVDTSGIITSLTGTVGSPLDIAHDTFDNLFYIAGSYIFKLDTTGVNTLIAGGGLGDGGAANNAILSNPMQIATSSSDDLYIAGSDLNRIRKVDAAGIITTFAGTGEYGYAGDGGQALAAQFRKPYGVAVDSSGNVYISEQESNVIRKINTSGIIETVAGVASVFYGDYGGDDGPATLAKLNQPSGIAVDSNGNLYIADTNNHRIRKVDSKGIISTVAGTGIAGISANNVPAIDAPLNYPSDVKIDSNGDIIIADGNNQRIYRVDQNGIINLVTTTSDIVLALLLDDMDNIYYSTLDNRIDMFDTSKGVTTVVAGVGQCCNAFSGDNGPALNAEIVHPHGIAFNNKGDLLISDYGNDRIRAVDFDNLPPSISEIPNQQLDIGTATQPLSFVIDDDHIALDSLSVTARSDNLKIVPMSGIALSGTGANRTIQITPAINKAYSANITISVSDDLFTTDSTFKVLFSIPSNSDPIPDQFDLLDEVDVPLASERISNSVTISGINTGTTITISDGEYSINGASFVSSEGIVTNGDMIRVRHIASAEFSTSITTTLTISGISDTFTSTTIAIENMPDMFSFTNQLEVPLNSMVTSNEITISGISTTAPVTITGGLYSINSGGFVSVEGSVVNDDVVRVRHTSSSTYTTDTTTTLTIGGVVASFTSTTETAPANSNADTGSGSLSFPMLILMFFGLYRYLPTRRLLKESGSDRANSL